ncbi:MAG TPA: hypothetical protein VFO76_11490 [Candidatus Kapabacteria bacterium]|nr:hypothetical protein [Candidatus Kapabacteria bacterium]
MNDAQPTPPIYHVLFHSPGPNWDPALSFQDQLGIMEHVRYMAGSGMIMGGPFLDNFGGMMMYDGSPEEAERIAHADPTVKNGLLTVVVRPWLMAIGS